MTGAKLPRNCRWSRSLERGFGIVLEGDLQVCFHNYMAAGTPNQSTADDCVHRQLLNNNSGPIRLGRISVMRKPGFRYLMAALALVLLAVFVFLPSGAGPGALPREMAFWGGLHNSLGHIDEAKWKWMEEKHKAEGDVPTMQDLAPYLGEWTNHIARFVKLGVTYKITPISEMKPQSDVATLTRDLRFQLGFCRYYRAGTRYSLQGEHVYPPYDTKSWLIALYQNNRGLLVIVLFALAVGNLLVFVIKSRNVREVKSVLNERKNV